MNDLVFVMCNLNLINKPTKKATGTTQVSLEDISSDDEWIAAEESPNEPNEEWPSVFHRDAQEEDENGDKDKEIHNLSDCELENEVRDFDDLPMDDLDGSNDIYGESLPLEDNIHQINDDLDLPSDPGLRPRITDYHPNDRDQVRRAYAQRKACQPKEHNFPYKTYGANNRRFNKGWFTRFDWLEYSIAKDAAFCLYCYLFKRDVGEQAGGDTFVTEGFSNWKCPEKLRIHEGGINSSHNQARRMFEDLLKPNQSIQSFHFKQTDQARIEYRTRLNASIDCIRFLLRQGLAFRGHDESEDSSNQGNFLELLKFLADHNEDIKAVTLRNAPENNMMISPAIQKDIVSAAAVETSNAIIMELGDAFFSVLIDESRDISTKEQMAVALRYVDKKGHVVERFLGIEHVTDTTALSLKAAVEDLFCRHGLSLSRLRGQGYDGASNMQGQFNGLKTLIMKENESAYYVHCFAHQLQLALVAVAKNNNKIATFFNFVANVVNIAGGSCKRLDLLKEKQATRRMVQPQS
uniref:TTF-type domain-containing protein n=1 Tax=Fagus sylvatica TaxID=28930 RepID=A0A2N9IB86_FAGSY